jgi:hypothetical protein
VKLQYQELSSLPRSISYKTFENGAALEKVLTQRDIITVFNIENKNNVTLLGNVFQVSESGPS